MHMTLLNADIDDGRGLSGDVTDVFGWLVGGDDYR